MKFETKITTISYIHAPIFACAGAGLAVGKIHIANTQMRFVFYPCHSFCVSPDGYYTEAGREIYGSGSGYGNKTGKKILKNKYAIPF